jgi:hypothetical protein
VAVVVQVELTGLMELTTTGPMVDYMVVEVEVHMLLAQVLGVQVVKVLYV